METCVRDLTTGRASARFRRALDARNPQWASTAALELQHVGLAEAVELTMIYLDKEPVRYETGRPPTPHPLVSRTCALGSRTR
jgi:hypothetical protein